MKFPVYLLVSFIFLSSFLFFPTPIYAQQALPAFPGAEGFGANSIGGRGGRIIEVTNLNATGTGSFREAIEATGPRIVVFRTGGTIDLNHATLTIVNPYLTIAGQTSPGDGITIKGGFIALNTHDVIIRYVRFRPGPGGFGGVATKAGSADGFRIGANNIILDHVSLSWGTDETLDINGSGVKNLTIQYSTISEALNCVPPPYNHSASEPCHSKHILQGYGSDEISFHHNLLAHGYDRNPLLLGGKLQWINNVIYNYGGPTYIIPRDGPISINIINNYYKSGVNSLVGRPQKHEIRLHSACTTSPCEYVTNSLVYISGNVGTDYPATMPRPAQVVCPDNSVCLTQTQTPFPFPSITTETAQAAYDDVLANVGATLPTRDAVDTRIINDVKNTTGKIINTPDEVGGYPVLTTGTAPLDTDHDGMPNAWEDQFKLNKNDAVDGNADRDSDGYTNVEEFLNSTNPGVLGDANNDELINLADFMVWLNHYRQNIIGVSNGEFTSDGKVNLLDFGIWLLNQGN